MRAFALGIAVAAFASLAQAQPASPPSTATEGTGSGSGATGMAPQQGTGSGATQHAPNANRPETGHGPGTETQQNQTYGRDTAPSGQPIDQSNPKRQP
ncbi:hypothetical protein ARD30_09505 [Bosea thiooxidans]|uniref:Uncharacterized protein n=1 Tax=Bosea thiooxidans TaxID=53254 RepID=A0A0Q3KNN0_9HYPH|nr:hypothetical protein [Bosea thiooxidans]KQK31299.1 hypothetical protein ARD30_09505 [Bosea thiooxidans]SKB37556.1 hypothetical protein SAMN05660750_00424 [Bosea thiooxidans]